MAHERNLTPAQAAALLGVSGSTLRRWSDDYADRLSEAASPGAGRKRTYTPDDLAVLQRAAALLKAGKPPAEVGALLGVVPESLAPTGSALVTLPKIAGDLSQAIEVIGRLQQLAQAQAAEVDRLRAEHERQAQALADIQRQQAEQAQAQAAEIEQLKAQQAHAQQATTQAIQAMISDRAALEMQHAQALAEIERRRAEQTQAQQVATQAEIAALRDELQALDRRGFWDRLLNRKPKPTGDK